MSTEEKIATKNPSSRKTGGVQRFFTQAHTFVYRLSGGKLTGQLGKSPVLLLNTTGRKTGKLRTTPLLYLRDGNNLVLVASNGGSPTHPTWWLNLQAHPEAEVEIGRQKLHVTARQADPEEHAHLWPRLVAMYAPYANYQKKTTRAIPVVILRPAD